MKTIARAEDGVPPDLHLRPDNPSGVSLCRVAVAWTFGFEGAQVARYHPLTET